MLNITALSYPKLKLDKVILYVLIVLTGIFLGHEIAVSSPNLLFLVLALVLAFCFFKRWEALLFLVAAAPFYGFFRYVLEIQSPAFVLAKELIIVVIFAGWLVYHFVINKQGFDRNAINLPVILFIVVSVIQLLRAPSLFQGLLGLRILVVYIFVFFVVANMKLDKKQIEKIVYLILVIGFVTSLYGVFQYLVGFDRLVDLKLAKVASNLMTSHGFRVFSTFSEPGVFAMYMMLGVLLCLVLLNLKLPKRRVILYIGLTVLFSFCLLTTLVRISVFMLIVGVIVLAVLTKKFKLIAFAGVIAVFVIILAPTYVTERMGMSFKEEDVSFQLRKEVYFKSNVEKVESNVLGTGLGTTSAGSVYRRLAEKQSSTAITTESGFANVLIETGILGLILYCWIFFAIVRYGLNLYRKLSDPFLKNVSAFIVTYVLVIFGISFVGPVMEAFPVGNLYFWLFVGLLVAMNRIEITSEHKTAELKEQTA